MKKILFIIAVVSAIFVAGTVSASTKSPSEDMWYQVKFTNPSVWDHSAKLNGFHKAVGSWMLKSLPEPIMDQIQTEVNKVGNSGVTKYTYSGMTLVFDMDKDIVTLSHPEFKVIVHHFDWDEIFVK